MRTIYDQIDLVLGADFERLRNSGAIPDERSRESSPYDDWPRSNQIPSAWIHELRFYPSVGGTARIQTVGIRLPEICCVCARPATCEFPMRPLLLWERFGAALGSWHGISVPHCHEHGGPFASLLFTIDYLRTCTPNISALGLSRHFLEEIRRLHTEGDMFAPWNAFGYYSLPAIGWNQGNKEDWMHSAWRPFWLGLANDERLSYLKRWKANQEWREFLLNDPRWHVEAPSGKA